MSVRNIAQFQLKAAAVVATLLVIGSMGGPAFGDGSVTREKWLCTKIGVEIAGDVAYAEKYLKIDLKGSYIIYDLKGVIEVKGDKITGGGRFTSFLGKNFTLTIDADIAEDGVFEGVIYQIFDSGRKNPYHFGGKLGKENVEAKHHASSRGFIGNLVKGGIGVRVITTKRGKKIEFTARRLPD